MRTPIRGFTLVEVLVALVVMSVLSGLAWQAVDGMSRTRRAVDASMDRTLTLNTALAQWEQDLQDLLSEGPVPAIHFDGVRLRLVRSRPEGAQLVVRSLPAGLWQRWAGPVTTQEVELTNQWASAARLQGREPGHLTLSDQAAAWQLYFFRGSSWSNAQSSGDLVAAGVAAAQGASGAAPPRERLPQGVRLVLMFQGALAEGPLTRDVLVPGGQP